MSDTIAYRQYHDRLTAAEASYTDLKSALRRLKIRSELLRYSAGLLSWLASISLLLMGWFLLGGVFRLPVILRASITAIWAGCAIWTGYVFIVKALIKRTSVERMAFRIERYYPELQDRLISSLQLWPELPENKYGYSVDFIARVVEEARVSLDGIDRSEVLAGDLRKFKRAGLAMIGVLLPLVIIIVLFPATFGDSLYAFAHPFMRTSGELIPVEIARVIPGDCTVQPGDDVEISAHVTGPAPSVALLHYRVEPGSRRVPTGTGQGARAPGRGEWRTMPLSEAREGVANEATTGEERRLKPATPPTDKEEGAEEEKSPLPPLLQSGGLETVFATKLQNVKESLEYYVSVPAEPGEYAGVQSRQYSITVIQRPIISGLQLELRYPRYMGLSPQRLGMNVGDVVAPLGTKVVIEATGSKDVASGFVVFDDKTKTRLEIKESRKLSGSFLVQRSGRYYVSITDTDGQFNSDAVRYSINAVADGPPRINIVQPGEDITIGEDMTIPLEIEAQDDYGIATVSLHYQIEGQGEKNIVSLGSYDSPQTSVSLKYTWDLGPLRLFPEDVVSYYAEAADTDNISGPNIGRSPVFTARFPSLYELYKEMEIEQQVEQSEMEDIISQQDDVKEMVDDLIGELKREKELDWAGKKELERSAELQRQIEEQMKNLAQQIDETVHKVEENPLIGAEALEKLQELRTLIDELATDEMKEIMRKLSEALDAINPSQQQRDLMAASLKQEEFIKKLDRMIDLFKRMQLKQKLEVAANQAEELVRQQTETLEQTEQLADQIQDSGLKTQDEEDRARSEVLADREMRIKKQSEELLSDLDGLAEEMKEMLPNIAEMLEQLTERAKQGQISDQLQRASSELKNCCPATALPFQLNALSKLSQLQSDLQATLEAMEGEDASEIIAALRDAIRSSLYLSHRHEEVMEATTAFNGEPEKMLPREKEIMDSLAADEIDLAEGSKKVASQLRELSHRTTSVRPELVWNLERAADGLGRAAAAMEDKLPALARPIQKNTLAALNRAIEDMLNSIDQINAQAMPMMGLEDYMEQLRQLAEQQSQLNQSTQDADNLRRKQGITPSLEEMLEKLAIEQSLIREATERLAAKLDQLAEMLGRLEEVAREMQEVEDSLRQGSLSENTIDKQRRILTRLLDYEKSLKRQDFSRQRQARTGREYTVERPSSTLPADATTIRKQLDTMLSPSAQEQWPAQYRELIKMYYKALSNIVRTRSGVAK